MGFLNDIFGFDKRRIEKERIRAEKTRVDRQVERESFPAAAHSSAGRAPNRSPQARASHRTDSSPGRSSESSVSGGDDFILRQTTFHSNASLHDGAGSSYSHSCGSASDNGSSPASDSSSSSSCDSSPSGD